MNCPTSDCRPYRWVKAARPEGHLGSSQSLSNIWNTSLLCEHVPSILSRSIIIIIIILIIAITTTIIIIITRFQSED
jgi:hypothetical protein